MVAFMASQRLAEYLQCEGNLRFLGTQVPHSAAVAFTRAAGVGKIRSQPLEENGFKPYIISQVSNPSSRSSMQLVSYASYLLFVSPALSLGSWQPTHKLKPTIYIAT